MKLNLKNIKKMKFNLSKPAIVTLIAYAIIGLIVLLPFNISSDELDKNIKEEYNIKSRLLIFTLLLIPFGLSIYSIQCMVVGGCFIWSWINAILIALWVILFVIVTLNKI
jgi:hypothetical protein